MEVEHIRWELDAEPNDDGTLAILEGDCDQSVIALVSPSVGENPNERIPSFYYARLIAYAPQLARAAKLVFDGLNDRIDLASKTNLPLPVFIGIAELSDVLHTIGLQKDSAP